MRVNGEHEMESETGQGEQFYEFLDADGLAKKLSVPTSWIREWCRKRCKDPIPAHGFGRYLRFAWRSPELDAWLARRLRNGRRNR